MDVLSHRDHTISICPTLTIGASVCPAGLEPLAYQGRDPLALVVWIIRAAHQKYRGIGIEQWTTGGTRLLHSTENMSESNRGYIKLNGNLSSLIFCSI